jgi:hypothetical protein
MRPWKIQNTNDTTQRKYPRGNRRINLEARTQINERPRAERGVWGSKEGLIQNSSSTLHFARRRGRWPCFAGARSNRPKCDPGYCKSQFHRGRVRADRLVEAEICNRLGSRACPAARSWLEEGRDFRDMRPDAWGLVPAPLHQPPDILREAKDIPALWSRGALSNQRRYEEMMVEWSFMCENLWGLFFGTDSQESAMRQTS